MEFLPYEINLYIFSKVPVMEFCVLKCVCKSWKKMIEDNQSALVQLHRASPSKSNSISNLLLIMPDLRDPRDLSCTYLVDCEAGGFRKKVLISKNVMGCGFYIVGSCNGLLCLMDANTLSRIVIINPITNQSMWLPNLDFNWRGQIVSCGFAYNSNTNSYKVIVIVGSEAVMFDSETYNNWRSVERRPNSLQRCFKRINPGIFLNGKIHWITHEEIVSFDLINEKFTSIKLPGHLLFQEFCDLIVFNGCLNVVKQFQRRRRSKTFCVLQMYRVETSWETIVRCRQPVKRPQYLQALGEIENGKILIRRGQTMLLFDPMHKEFKSLPYQRPPTRYKSIIHFPSLDWPRF